MQSYFYCFLLLTLMACGQTDKRNTQVQVLQPGDLLFQDLDCGPLCDAIEAVTQGAEGRSFSHCGLLVEHEGSLWVLEAVGNGVRRTPLPEFFRRSADTVPGHRMLAGRLKAGYQNLLPEALAWANTQIGQPYDHAFLPDNGHWYCSELIHAAFLQANGGQEVFHLEPMTYKIPGSDAFFPAWETYFNELGIPIPEGLPGINPGGISRSEKLDLFVPPLPSFQP